MVAAVREGEEGQGWREEKEGEEKEVVEGKERVEGRRDGIGWDGRRSGRGLGHEKLGEENVLMLYPGRTPRTEIQAEDRNTEINYQQANIRHTQRREAAK